MNNCFGFNEKNYMCTICKQPYGKENGMPEYMCYQPKAIKTNGDMIMQSYESFADWLEEVIYDHDIWVNLSHEELINYLKQPYNG